MVTGCPWWDFVSYNPYYKNPLFIFRVERDEELIKQLTDGIAEMEKAVKDIKERAE